MESLDHDLRSAYGRMHLVYPEKDSPTGLRTSKGQLRAHTATCYDTELMDYIDAVFQKSAEIIERSTEGEGGQEAQRLASEINRIFEEEGVGYRWVGGRLVRFDGEITHTEATLPALNALAAGRFGAAEGEFDAAVAAYGRGAWRDTLTHANAALESVLKIATGKRGTAGPLIAEAKKKGLIPDYLEASAESLAEMAHAVPAARGQQGSSHGLGDKPPKADERLARLVLTTTAAWITFLADRSP
jgi:hypothetical protein